VIIECCCFKNFVVVEDFRSYSVTEEGCSYKRHGKQDPSLIWIAIRETVM